MGQNINNQKNNSDLLNLNNEFYENTAASFSATREFFWAGWEKVGVQIMQMQSLRQVRHQKQLETTKRMVANNPNYKINPADYNLAPLKILDLGCGNARFAEFIAQKFSEPPYQSHSAKSRAKITPPIPFIYYGVDNSPSLLAFAQEKIAANIINHTRLKIAPETTFNLETLDLSQDTELQSYLKKNGPFDVICLFGVMHHLPSAQNRLNFLQNLAPHLKTSSLLCVSLWQFMNDKRLANKAIDKSAEFEANDYLLDWKRSDQNPQNSTDTPISYRYCHHFTNSEIEQLLTDLTHYKLIHRYQADGPQNNLNTYLILQATPNRLK